MYFIKLLIYFHSVICIKKAVKVKKKNKGKKRANIEEKTTLYKMNK